MPETKTLTIEPAEMRKGDVLVQTCGRTMVGGLKRGTTRLHILDPEGAPLTWVYLSEPVTVERQVETEAERAAALEERLQEEAEAIVLSLEVMAASDPLKAFTDRAATDNPEHEVWQLKRTLESYTDDLFIGACLKGFAQEVLAVAAHEEASAQRTVEIAVGRARQAQLKALDRFGSRSTSHFSNLMEDAERAAATRWLDSFDVRFYLAKVDRKEVLFG